MNDQVTTPSTNNGSSRFWQPVDQLTLADQPPLSNDDTAETASILKTVVAAFMPELSPGQVEDAIQIALANTFKQKKLATWVTFDHVLGHEDDPASEVSFGEMFHGATMTLADIASLLMTTFADKLITTQHVFVSTNPDLLIALGHQLTSAQKLLGIVDGSQLDTFRQIELNAIADQANCQIFDSSSPTTACVELTSHENLQVVDVDELLSLMPVVAALRQLLVDAPTNQPLDLAIDADHLELAVAAGYANTLNTAGTQFGHINVSTLAQTPFARLIAGESVRLPQATQHLLNALMHQLLPDATPSIEFDAGQLQRLMTSQDFCTFEVVFKGQAKQTIKQFQMATNYTIGVTTAVAATPLLLANKKSDHKQLVIAPLDAYLTPEFVLESITGRDDGKRDFESIQILRQIINAKPPRAMTRLKSIELAPIPPLDLDEIHTWLN